MPKTISFTTLQVKKVVIDVAASQVQVSYSLTDDTGLYSRHGTAIFTRPLPADMPDDWFLLPATRAQQLLDLVADIQTAMQNKLLT